MLRARRSPAARAPRHWAAGRCCAAAICATRSQPGAHSAASPRSAASSAPAVATWRARCGVGTVDAQSAARSSQRSACSASPMLEICVRRADRRQELECPVAQWLEPVRTPARRARWPGPGSPWRARRRERRRVIWASAASRSLPCTRVAMRAHQLADALEALRWIGAQVQLRTPIQVGEADDRRHRPAPIAQLLEQLQRLRQLLLGAPSPDRAIGSSLSISSIGSPCGDARDDRACARRAWTRSTNQARIRASSDRAELAQDDWPSRSRIQLCSASTRARSNASCAAVEVGLERRRRVALAERRAEQVLAELEARAQLVGSVIRPRRPRSRTLRATSAAASKRLSARSAAARRSCTSYSASLSPTASTSARQLGDRLEPLGRPAQGQSASSRMHSSSTRCAGWDTTPSASSTMRSASSGALARSAARAASSE